MSDGRSVDAGALFLRGARAGLTAQVVAFASQIGLLLLVLRALPPEEFGRYALATAALGLTAVVAGLQLDQQVARDLDGDLRSYLRAAAAAATAIAVVAFSLALLSSPSMRPLYMLGAMVHGPVPLQRVLVGAASRSGAGRVATAGRWLPGLVRVTTVVVLASLESLAATSLMLGDLVASVAVTAVLVRWAAKTGSAGACGQGRSLRTIGVAALPLLAAAGAWVVIARVDVVMMSAFGVRTDAIGGYQAILRVLDVGFALHAATLLFFVPALSREPRRSGALFAVAAYPVAALAIVVLSAVVTGGLDGLVGGVMGAYAPESTLLSWVAVAGFVHIATGPTGLVLVAQGRARSLATGSALAALVNVALNVVLIPRHGPIGGAIATATALAVLNASYFGSVSRDPDVGSDARAFLAWLAVATMGTVGVGLMLAVLSVGLVMPVASLMMAALLATSGRFRTALRSLRGGPRPVHPPGHA